MVELKPDTAEPPVRMPQRLSVVRALLLVTDQSVSDPVAWLRVLLPTPAVAST